MRGGPEAALAPRLVVSDAGRVEELERFSHYVGTVLTPARAFSFGCPRWCWLLTTIE